MNGYIDQIDHNIALVFIGDQSIYIPVDALPVEAREGSHLILSFQIDKERESLVKEEVKNLIGAMAENEGDDFTL